MRGDDNVVEVGPGDKGGEEGVWIAEGFYADGRGVGDVTIPPVHGAAQLAAALYEKQRCWAHLHAEAFLCLGIRLYGLLRTFWGQCYIPSPNPLPCTAGRSPLQGYGKLADSACLVHGVHCRKVESGHVRSRALPPEQHHSPSPLTL